MTGPFDQLSKVFLHRTQIEAIADGQIPPPVSVKIELTNVCNHDCHFCAYRRLVQKPELKDMIQTERVLALVDELAAGGVEGLMFTGGGEPLLHPGVSKVFARCRARGLQHGLITNGVQLAKLNDEDLRGLRWIRFSVNAGTADEYQNIHAAGRDDWRQVWQQIARVASRREFPNLTVGLSFVVTTRNVLSVTQAAQRAVEAGADYAHFRPAFQGPHSQLDRQLDEDERKVAIAACKKLEALQTESFRIYGIERRFREIEQPERRYIHCRSTPLVAYVLPTGQVSLCTLVRATDFNPKVKNPFLGTIDDANFFDLWGSQHHRSLIEALSDSSCQRCHFAVYNQAIESFSADVMHRHFL